MNANWDDSVIQPSPKKYRNGHTLLIYPHLSVVCPRRPVVQIVHDFRSLVIASDLNNCCCSRITQLHIIRKWGEDCDDCFNIVVDG